MMKVSPHLHSPELTGQVQRSLLGLVDQTGVGLVLQQHLRLSASKQQHNRIITS